MKTEVLLRSIGRINDELIADAESEANTKRKPGWAKLGIMAACLALVLAVALVIPTLTQQDQSIITENEPGVKLTLEEAMDDKTFGTLFPKKILEGYVLEDAPSIWGITDYAELKTADNAVLKANFYNEELEDEMVIRIASKEWFLSHEKNSIELNTIYYRETIDKAGSYIYFESGDEIISYSFSTRDIAQIDGFCDMVNSASADTSSVSVSKFISLEEAKEIALKDAKLDELTQKIVFTREELSRNQGKPCYLLEFYTGTNQYFYQIDAKSGSIIYAGKFITLSEAKKIALDDAGVSEKVTFTEETLVAGGIKSPYYYFAFESDSARWTYKIDAVLGVIMDKTCDKIIPPAPEFIGLEKAKQIALEDAGLDEAAQKIVFTREELSRNSGKPCYILEFYTDKCAYSYKIDAVSGEVIGKKTEWFSRQESETVPDTSQNSDSKHR